MKTPGHPLIGTVFRHQEREFVVWSARWSIAYAIPLEGPMGSALFPIVNVEKIATGRDFKKLWPRLREFENHLLRQQYGGRPLEECIQMAYGRKEAEKPTPRTKEQPPAPPAETASQTFF